MSFKVERCVRAEGLQIGNSCFEPLSCAVVASFLCAGTCPDAWHCARQRFVLLNPNSESRNLAPKLPPRGDAVRGLEQEPVEEVPARRGSRD